MFWPDVIALKEFYASPLGQVTQLVVNRSVRQFWGSAKNDLVLGLGFAPPYLAPLRAEAHLCAACMPAPQGVIHWPATGASQSILCDEGELPFSDNSVQRMLVVHALENSEQARLLLAEAWRVLSPAGRLLVIVPNRMGIWARSPLSPFAYGQPFSGSQLRQLMAEHSFTPVKSASALFFPPSRNGSLRSLPLWEWLGKRLFPAFGGVLLVEAEKQIYAPSAPQARYRRQRAYAPLARPAGI